MSNPRIPYQMASDRARLPPPQPDKPLIVHVVVNVEYWPFDQPMPRKLLPGPHGNDKIPDVPNFSWVEYGMRAGFPAHCAGVEEPRLARIDNNQCQRHRRLSPRRRGDAGERMGVHGPWLDAEGAADRARRSSRDRQMQGTHRAFHRQKLRGWLGAGLSETMHTPDVLKSRGLDYVCDWVIDDLPTWMRTAHGPLIAAPYSLGSE